VLHDGSVGDLEIVACSQPGLGFEESALGAVKKWQFDPATRDGAPVDSYALVHLYFAPPSGRLAGGSVRSNLFLMTDLPTGLPGAPAPVERPDLPSVAGSNDGRPNPQGLLIRPPCGPRSGKCLYDREALLLEAKRRQGEGGLRRPMPTPRDR
jgi:hypothetical protein